MEQHMDAGIVRQYLHGLAISCLQKGLLTEGRVRQLEHEKNVALWGVVKEAVRSALVESQELEDPPLEDLTAQAWGSTSQFHFFHSSPESGSPSDQLADMPTAPSERWKRIVAAVERRCGWDADGSEDDEDDRPTRVHPAPEELATELMAQSASSPPPPLEEAGDAAPDLVTALKRASEAPAGGAAMTVPPVTNPNVPPPADANVQPERIGRGTLPDTPLARVHGCETLRPGPRPDTPSVEPIMRSPVPRISGAPVPVKSPTRTHLALLFILVVSVVLVVMYRSHSSGPTDADAKTALDDGVPVPAVVQDPWKHDGTRPVPDTAMADAGIVTNGVTKGGVRVGPALEASDAQKPLNLDDLDNMERIVKSPPLPPVETEEAPTLQHRPDDWFLKTDDPAVIQIRERLLRGERLVGNAPAVQRFLFGILSRLNTGGRYTWWYYGRDASTNQMWHDAVKELDRVDPAWADRLRHGMPLAAVSRAADLPASGL